MAILNLKVVLEQESEAGLTAAASISSLEKGEAAITIAFQFIGAKTGRPIGKAGKLVVAKDGKSITNGDGNPVNATPPKDSDSRLADALRLFQEWIQAARDCGEIPEVITIGMV